MSRSKSLALQWRGVALVGRRDGGGRGGEYFSSEIDNCQGLPIVKPIHLIQSYFCLIE